jgi:hypothetical protein
VTSTVLYSTFSILVSLVFNSSWLIELFSAVRSCILFSPQDRLVPGDLDRAELEEQVTIFVRKF